MHDVDDVVMFVMGMQCTETCLADPLLLLWERCCAYMLSKISYGLMCAPRIWPAPYLLCIVWMHQHWMCSSLVHQCCNFSFSLLYHVQSSSLSDNVPSALTHYTHKVIFCGMWNVFVCHSGRGCVGTMLSLQINKLNLMKPLIRAVEQSGLEADCKVGQLVTYRQV